MLKRVAVMDLGTNTFHLLIAEGTPAVYKEIYHDNIAVKLGEGGINQGLIQPLAFERGLQTMKAFSDHIALYEIKEIKAIATSALRSASNGKKFIDEVRSETGIAIQTIDGETEAGYIFKGVQSSGTLSDQCSLIMDIGGGSIEFIIADKITVYWKKSFEIGAARLMDKFHQADPIPADSIKALQGYLDEVLPQLYTAVTKYAVNNIIGSSGAFETFAEMAERNIGNSFNLKSLKTYRFDTTALLAIFESIIKSSHSERVSNPYIIPVRVDMIVVASLVTRYLMQKLKINTTRMSAYSLKEGVLVEMLA